MSKESYEDSPRQKAFVISRPSDHLFAHDSSLSLSSEMSKHSRFLPLVDSTTSIQLVNNTAESEDVRRHLGYYGLPQKPTRMIMQLRRPNLARSFERMLLSNLFINNPVNRRRGLHRQITTEGSYQ
jgi:hypothetical protein